MDLIDFAQHVYKIDLWPETLETLKRIDDSEAHTIYLYGEPGTSKTTIAAIVLVHAIHELLSLPDPEERFNVADTAYNEIVVAGRREFDCVAYYARRVYRDGVRKTDLSKVEFTNCVRLRHIRGIGDFVGRNVVSGFVSIRNDCIGSLQARIAKRTSMGDFRPRLIVEVPTLNSETAFIECKGRQ